MIHPASDCLVRNCNSALREQVLDVAKAEGEPEIEPDRLVNDLWREPISGIADFRYALRLPSRRSRDNALSRVHWVEPKLVVEITYLTWTADNLLRHTVYVGLREDQPAEQIRRER
jgi:ATP-dependent DNA ligase